MKTDRAFRHLRTICSAIPVLLCMIALAGGCKSSSNPSGVQYADTSSHQSGPPMLKSGTYEGTFIIYYFFSADSIGGHITFSLMDTSYVYKGMVDWPASARMDSIGDSGSTVGYITADSVFFLDAAYLPGPCCQPSLYLAGKHHYTFDGTNLTMTQSTTTVGKKFSLKKK
ncbi:MAG: hypothetical protein ABIR47_00740 [Candidatus Kapaibacterium sp.]